jgi:mannose-1-phosphate guanylyltransferase
MMTFESPSPQSCGIVEVDKDGIVIAFQEKLLNPISNCANGAIYLLEPEILAWLEKRQNITDFSTQVIPQFLGHIATWKNEGIHRDIGTLKKLKQSQSDPKPVLCWPEENSWQDWVSSQNIYLKLSEFIQK